MTSGTRTPGSSAQRPIRASDSTGAGGTSTRPDLDESANDLIESVEALPPYRPTVGCIIPAYNEEESIASVLDSLLGQTRLPDVIHVIVNNTTDATVEFASHYAGAHGRRTGPDEYQETEVFVHDIGANPHKKVGALNYGHDLVEAYDYLLGVDGDTTADPTAVKILVDEISSDTRIGGISAIYSIDDTDIRGPIAPFLITGQRARFAATTLSNMLKGRDTAVLDGQFTIFSTKALREVMENTHQQAPWGTEGEIEDSVLSVRITGAGYLTKISAHARANVGGKHTLRALDAQQVKWSVAAIELLWPGRRGDTTGRLFHPNLRLRRLEQLSMVGSIVSRVLFILLLVASLSIDAFVFSPWWLIPPVVAIVLNLRVALSMTTRNGKDILFALLLVPAEIYMWIRIGHVLRAWATFAARTRVDAGVGQAQAERGSGNAYLAPFIGIIATGVALTLVWFQLSPGVQSTILWVCWPVLGVIAIIQTLTMVFSIVRPHRGYRV